jgi:hypothetical protein
VSPIERLVAIEEIKQLKAKYFYYFDHQDWDNWRDQVWAPDARLEVPEMNSNIEPRDTMIAWVIEQSADQVSVHHGHTPIIEITSDNTATGIWAMEDRIYRSKEHPLNGDTAFVIGFGHYHETYVKLGIKGTGGWRIRSTRLSRLRTQYAKVF